MKYPIGIQNFEKIREGGYLYIDKTDLIYDLVNNGVYYFLSRPRRFGKVSVFSDLNNLRDISMLKAYEKICGITEEELHSVFKDGIKDLGAANDMSEEETKAELKELYDGYHFNNRCVDIYNLSGLMITLDSKALRSNWIEVGTPSFLVKMLKNRDSDLGDLEGVEIDGSLLESNDTASKNLIPVIYQSGYLTIKDYDKKSNIYKLGFPNKHVKNAFMTLMKYI